MDPVFLATAFLLGFGFRQIGLPPMIGFLATGFVLKAFGYHSTEFIEHLAEVGVVLLLFTIGLKLRVETLLKREVWGATSLHMVIIIVLFGAAIFALTVTSLEVFTGLDMASSALIAFGLSFSSTVFAIKALEERGEVNTLHGRVAIGILVMQDIIAVLFITASSGILPSPWALALLGLPLLRPFLYMIINRSGHGELVPLFGLCAAIVIGAALFQLVGLKADLGALVLGIMLAGHPRASELFKSLLTFKDIFLIGFFLNIGLTGVLSIETVVLALILVALVPLKAALYFFLLTKLRLRARSSLLTAFSLSTYSEFGLIVGSIGVAHSWLPSEWLTVLAVAVAISFAVVSPVNIMGHEIYARLHDFLVKWETGKRHPDDMPIDVGNARIAILGMGRIGVGAYETMRDALGDVVLGIESDPVKIAGHKKAGRNVILGDATDSDLWDRMESGKIRMVMLTLPELSANLDVVHRLKSGPYSGEIAAVARFTDEVPILEAAGVAIAVDSFTEAGVGFADHVQLGFKDELQGIKDKG